MIEGCLEGMVTGRKCELLNLSIIGWGKTGLKLVMGGGDLSVHCGEGGSCGTDAVAE